MKKILMMLTLIISIFLFGSDDVLAYGQYITPVYTDYSSSHCDINIDYFNITNDYDFFIDFLSSDSYSSYFTQFTFLYNYFMSNYGLEDYDFVFYKGNSLIVFPKDSGTNFYITSDFTRSSLVINSSNSKLEYMYSNNSNLASLNVYERYYYSAEVYSHNSSCSIDDSYSIPFFTSLDFLNFNGFISSGINYSPDLYSTINNSFCFDNSCYSNQYFNAGDVLFYDSGNNYFSFNKFGEYGSTSFDLSFDEDVSAYSLSVSNGFFDIYNYLPFSFLPDSNVFMYYTMFVYDTELGTYISKYNPVSSSSFRTVNLTENQILIFKRNLVDNVDNLDLSLEIQLLFESVDLSYSNSDWVLEEIVDNNIIYVDKSNGSFSEQFNDSSPSNTLPNISTSSSSDLDEIVDSVNIFYRFIDIIEFLLEQISNLFYNAFPQDIQYLYTFWLLCISIYLVIRFIF